MAERYTLRPARSTPAPVDAAKGDLGGRSSVALGLFLLVTAICILSGPGRIDMIDGQIRCEAAMSWHKTGRPELRDPAMHNFGVEAPDGRIYAGYNAAASLMGLPLVALADLGGDPLGERRRFFFSLTSAFLIGLLASVAFLFYGDLGIARRSAIGWTLALVFATHLWWLGTSSFDQGQHAFFVLLAAYLGVLAGRRGSLVLAAAGGLAVAILINYQETFLILAPTLALTILARPVKTAGESADRAPDQGARRHPRWMLLATFLGAAAVGLALWFEYNQMRFGSPFVSNRFGLGAGHPGLLGNPLAGITSLLVSPGKSVFLFSPPLLLALLGLPGLYRRFPRVARAVIATAVVQLVFVSCLSFFGSDWAWGPRYITVVIPLLGLALPFALPGPQAWRRGLRIGIVGAGIGVQLLGLAVDHQRFFFDNKLPDFFWALDPWTYFERSQLFARPAEIAEVFAPGVPAEADRFQPTPYRHSVTYCMFGNPVRHVSEPWLRQFEVFWRPRPWPLWMASIEPERRPVPLGPSVLALLAMGAVGGGLVGRTLRRP